LGYGIGNYRFKALKPKGDALQREVICQGVCGVETKAPEIQMQQKVELAKTQVRKKNVTS
jgi:hypothetical protein